MDADAWRDAGPPRPPSRSAIASADVPAPLRIWRTRVDRRHAARRLVTGAFGDSKQLLEREEDHYGRAMRWSRCFFDYPPAWPGAGIMAFAYQGFRARRPVGLPRWVARARAAEGVGFTADSYYLLQLTLSAVDASRFPSHPDNHCTSGWAGYAERPFDADSGAAWLHLVDRGATARCGAGRAVRPNRRRARVRRRPQRRGRVVAAGHRERAMTPIARFRWSPSSAARTSR